MSSAEMRERRKAKILMSSEERMKKVMGLMSNDINDRNCASDPRADPAQHLNDATEIVPPPIPRVRRRSPPAPTADDNTPPRPRRRPEVAADRDDDASCLHRRSLRMAGGATESGNVDGPKDDRIFDERTELNDREESAEKSSVSSSEDSSRLSYGRFRTFVVFALGVAVRCVLTSRFFSYVQTAVYPFIAIEMLIYGIQRTTGLDLGNKMAGGVWLAILHMTGVDPQILDSYKNIMSLVYLAFDDFSLYIFAFLLTHVVLQ